MGTTFHTLEVSKIKKGQFEVLELVLLQVLEKLYLLNPLNNISYELDLKNQFLHKFLNNSLLCGERKRERNDDVQRDTSFII